MSMHEADTSKMNLKCIKLPNNFRVPFANLTPGVNIIDNSGALFKLNMKYTQTQIMRKGCWRSQRYLGYGGYELTLNKYFEHK